MIGWISLPGMAPAPDALPLFVDSGASHEPITRGARTVVPDVYFGPDVVSSSGAYLRPSDDVLAEDASYAPVEPAPSRRASTNDGSGAKPASLVPWIIAGGVVVVAGATAWLLLARGA